MISNKKVQRCYAYSLRTGLLYSFLLSVLLGDFTHISSAGLPPSGSWQDLKDHMREAGDVCYADVYRDGSGVVEYLRYDDMKYALRKLDDTKFKSHEVGLYDKLGFAFN